MISYAQTLPLTDVTGEAYSLVELVGDLINHAKSNMATNAVVVPVIQTFTLLFEADALRQLPVDPTGLKQCVIHSSSFWHHCESFYALSLEALSSMCSRNVGKLKSTQRIHESMKMSVAISLV